MIWGELKCIFKVHALTKGMEHEFTVIDQIKSFDEMTILILLTKDMNFLDLEINQNIFDVKFYDLRTRAWSNVISDIWAGRKNELVRNYYFDSTI